MHEKALAILFVVVIEESVHSLLIERKRRGAIREKFVEDIEHGIGTFHEGPERLVKVYIKLAVMVDATEEQVGIGDEVRQRSLQVDEIERIGRVI